ncbi:MAG TPA: phenylalanine--tRNA ligase subunit beta [Solirubrobacterales bacterium]|nr:phenylalanine--tRNA ligase subunit beta [Solirubrobacterales bacterium]
MRIPYAWMATYCDPGLKPEVLAEKLAMTGTEVERVVTTGPPSADNFVIGKVLATEPHPDADRLRVCTVDTGDESPRNIVCGAPNVAAGQTVVVALPGAVMPGGMKIKKAKLRGVPSEGMICSETELELGEGSDGIMVLEDGIAQPGTPAGQVLPVSQIVLELEVTPNRTDCFSLYGVAREAHAITGAALAASPWEGKEIASGDAVESLVSVEVEDPELCPRFTALAFEDVKVGPSPLWLKARLIAAGQRPINNVVDITNYVMWLTGQPMHAFDLDLVPDGALTVRSAREGEKVTTLDGIEREPGPDTVLVCDRNGPAAIAGIMGGAVSEVSEATTSVLMEAATWNGPNILRSSRDLNLRSEASSRFEKQLHPALTVRAQIVAAELMAELCGATVVEGMVDVAAPMPDPAPIRLRAGRVERILGLAIEPDAQVEALELLGFTVEREGDDLLVTVPPDRFYDVTREIDVVEEVGRVNDLDRRLPATLPSGSGRVGGLSRQQSLQRRAEDSLREAGFDEIVGWSFTDPGETDRLRITVPDPRANAVKLSNPLSEDQSVMRSTLLGSLLGAAQRNLARGAESVALFESGRVYLPAGEFGPGPLGGNFPGEQRPPVNEPHHFCALATGSIDPASWAHDAVTADFFQMKGVLERLAAGLGTTVQVIAGEQPFLHPGRSGEVLIDGRGAGWIGQLHPTVAAEWDLGEAVAFEIGLADLLEASPLGEEKYVDFTAFPPVDRDLAVVLPDSVEASGVLEAARTAGGKLLKSVTVFDVYRGDQVGEDEKSLALRFRFRADDRTLSDDEVAPQWQKIIAALEGLGGKLRG